MEPKELLPTPHILLTNQDGLTWLAPNFRSAFFNAGERGKLGSIAFWRRLGRWVSCFHPYHL